MSISNGTHKGLKCESSPNMETHICARCTQEIHERYFLKMDDLTWHTRCLKCSVCRIPLHQHTSCYVKNQEIFCKMDYNSTFGIKCAWCGHHISATDWVRRAKNYTYHLACFACFSCKRQLSTGEQFGLVDSRVMCRKHYDIVVENVTAEHGLEGALPSNCLSLPSKRTRTSFSSEQLQVLQTQFTQESNPDAQTLQRLAEMTGLSRRVIQVWFQNSRARHRRHPAMTLDEPQCSPFCKPETVQLSVMQAHDQLFPLTATQGFATMVPHSPFSYEQYSLHVGATQME